MGRDIQRLRLPSGTHMPLDDIMQLSSSEEEDVSDEKKRRSQTLMTAWQAVINFGTTSFLIWIVLNG